MYDVSGKWEMICIYSRFVAKQTARTKNEFSEVKTWKKRVKFAYSKFERWKLFRRKTILYTNPNSFIWMNRMLSFRTLLIDTHVSAIHIRGLDMQMQTISNLLIFN